MKNKRISLGLILFGIMLLSSFVSAHGEVDDGHVEESSIESDEKDEWPDPLIYVKISGLIFTLMAIVSVFIKNESSETLKKLIFWIMVVPIILSAFYLAIHTVNLNITSVTKGPVHWHADTEIWMCGEEVDLVDPKGMSGKVGSNILHEHNDGRIHVEGVVQKLSDVDLGSYFTSIGGELQNDKIALPTHDGLFSYTDGDICKDDKPGNLHVYVNGKQINNPAEYVPAAKGNVPPGDCIIFEFGTELSATTDKLCNSWDTSGWNYENQELMRE